LTGLFWDLSQLYSAGKVSVVTPLSADFDSDGDVDAFDLATWKAGFGSASATHSQGDANGDGRVDGADQLLWQRQAGTQYYAGSLVATNAVPEPAAPLLAAALMTTGSIRRRSLPSFRTGR
jgi:hypothetical protein